MNCGRNVYTHLNHVVKAMNVLVLTSEEWSHQDADAGPEVGERPGDVDGQTCNLARRRVRVHDGQTQESTHHCNTHVVVFSQLLTDAINDVSSIFFFSRTL